MSTVQTIAICDTEPIVVEGLRSLIEPADWLRVVAADTTLADAQDTVREVQPGILLVDKALGFGAVMDWITALRATEPSPAVVVWGTFVSESEALRLLQAGTSGIVRKTASLDALLACLRAVARGGSWVEDYMLSPDDIHAGSANPRLTPRELEVLALVERGMRNKDIGNALGISAGTVKIHLKHIFEKTGIHGRYGLAVSALKDKGMAPAGVLQLV
jgi:DNA-binding NarL/FixJ family response regulator